MQNKIDYLWSTLRVISKDTWPYSKFEMDPNEYRFDDHGAIIKWGEYGKETDFGWTVDHIFPKSKGGDDNILNLQLLHWKNNKEKGDDFPEFRICVTRAEAEKNKFTNKDCGLKVAFSDVVIKVLSDIYVEVEQYPKQPGEWYNVPSFTPENQLGLYQE
jgi:hypothetical protein